MVCQFAAQDFRRIDFHEDSRAPTIYAILIKEPVRASSVAKKRKNDCNLDMG